MSDETKCPMCGDVHWLYDPGSLPCLRRQLAAKDKRIAELEAIVGKTYKTKDGSLIGIGSEVWSRVRDAAIRWTVKMIRDDGLILCTRWASPTFTDTRWFVPEEMYGTPRAAAEKATKEKP